MAGLRLIAAGLSAVVLAAAAGVACAETAAPIAPGATFTTRDAFAPDQNRWGSQAGRRSLQWDSKKAKWGLKLDLDTPVGRPLSYADRDVQAGAFYKVTPSFRVGGAVSLGALNDTQTVIPPDKAPRVRLETALKF
jgi:hypothetical protein